MAIKTETHKAKANRMKHLLFPRSGHVKWAEAGCVQWLS